MPSRVAPRIRHRIYEIQYLAKRKGITREAVSEGSAEQNRGLTNRNRIRGILGRTSGRRTAKSTSIKGQGCRSGRGAGKAIELTWGGLRHVPVSELRPPRGALTVAQESAEGVVGQTSVRLVRHSKAERRSNR